MASHAPASSACSQDLPADIFGRTVADAMLHRPRIFDAATTVATLRDFFTDDHVHAALVVDAAGRLVAVVDPEDLRGHDGDDPAVAAGVLAGRALREHTDLALTWWAMRASGRRRLAVVDADGVLLGLLCLKRSGRGFCADADAEARRRERDAARAVARRRLSA